jgi:hypothetical protein
MSVWQTTPAKQLSLRGSEGALISVSVIVDARDLEELLDALAQMSFPINPQIYHDAAVRYLYADGRQETKPTTLVEFPAYAGRLPEIRDALAAYGFAPDSLHAAGMLDEIHSGPHLEPAPPGAPYQARERIKHARVAVAGR